MNNELTICSYSKKGENLIKTLKLNDHKQNIKWQILNFRNLQNLIIDFIYFTPRTYKELIVAVNLWCKNKKEAIKKYGDINSWNVQNITDMSELFGDCYKFNDNINNWDVSNVTDMRSMFSYCYNFNQQLYKWDVSNVIDMNNMFYWCTKFNQQLNNWNVSNVQNMRGMFSYCEKLKSKPNWYYQRK